MQYANSHLCRVRRSVAKCLAMMRPGQTDAVYGLLMTKSWDGTRYTFSGGSHSAEETIAILYPR